MVIIATGEDTDEMPLREFQKLYYYHGEMWSSQKLPESQPFKPVHDLKNKISGPGITMHP